MGVSLQRKGRHFTCTDDASVQALERSSFGTRLRTKPPALSLLPEEALYLMDVRNATCTDEDGRQESFNQAAAPFQNDRKFLARYFGYRDWRDRGVIPRPASDATGNYGRSPVVKYPAGDFPTLRVNAPALFFTDDLMAVIDDEAEGQRVYEERWFGQYGTYKAKKHGRYCKLDAYEALFLATHAGLQLNVTPAQLEKLARKRRPDFRELYDVFEDWRLRGFVLKTGFKFGTHFRLYFPGASPQREGTEWMHSKHVIHVFPRAGKLLISEWARAIRVAHGVKKTFILAIPGARPARKAAGGGAGGIDFLLYHRRGAEPETPKTGSPAFAMLALSEEEKIGGEELAAAIAHAKKLGLDVMLAICDRETAVTYYRVKRIELPRSAFEYYEIEWVQP